MFNFITSLEPTTDQLYDLIDLARFYKKGGKLPNYSGKLLTLMFANPSLRTQLSFAAAMKKMGGAVNVLYQTNSWQWEYQEGVVMNGHRPEHIKEAARVISGYSDLIGLRQSDLISNQSTNGETISWERLKQDEAINQLAKYATKPVINLESNMWHPCQALADMMTMMEYFGKVKNKKYVLTWAPHPKALPLATPHSQLLLPAIFGMDMTLVYPEGFPLETEVIKMVQKKAAENGGSLAVSHDQKAAFNQAEVIVAKSWASLQYFGDWTKESDYRQKQADWIITKAKMQLTNQAVFLHCLPVRRNVVVTDEVLDSAQSLVINEAANRMWTSMALIDKLLNFNPSNRLGASL